MSHFTSFHGVSMKTKKSLAELDASGVASTTDDVLIE
jgi:hypothetical protein